MRYCVLCVNHFAILAARMWRHIIIIATRCVYSYVCTVYVNHSRSAAAIEEESGIVLEEEFISQFRSGVLSGDWTLVISLHKHGPSCFDDE